MKDFLLNQITIEEKMVLPWKQSEKRGLLIGLYDAQRRFLGIGILREVDSARKTLKIITAVQAKPSTIALGKTRLDENVKEISSLLGAKDRAQQVKV